MRPARTLAFPCLLGLVVGTLAVGCGSPQEDESESSGAAVVGQTFRLKEDTYITIPLDRITAVREVAPAESALPMRLVEQMDEGEPDDDRLHPFLVFDTKSYDLGHRYHSIESVVPAGKTVRLTGSAYAGSTSAAAPVETLVTYDPLGVTSWISPVTVEHGGKSAEQEAGRAGDALRGRLLTVTSVESPDVTVRAFLAVSPGGSRSTELGELLLSVSTPHVAGSTPRIYPILWSAKSVDRLGFVTRSSVRVDTTTLDGKRIGYQIGWSGGEGRGVEPDATITRVGS